MLRAIMLIRTDDGRSSTYIYLSSLGKDFKLGCQVSGGSIGVKRSMPKNRGIIKPSSIRLMR